MLRILSLANKYPTEFTRAYNDNDIKPLQEPFWEHLLYVNMFLSIILDILYQLLQGMFKHLFTWIKNLYNPWKLNSCYQKMPPNSNVHNFLKGITSLACISKKKHHKIVQVIYSLLSGLPFPDGMSFVHLIQAMEAILDFLYLAQHSIHTQDTLDSLEDTLHHFHLNKSIFVDLGLCNNFHIPKLKFLWEYQCCIELMGTPDNFNTEYTEQLYIDFTKDMYNATNHKDEYPQMAIWLECKEKIQEHNQYIQWHLVGQPSIALLNPLATNLFTHIKMTKWPLECSVPFDDLVYLYGVKWFSACLA